MNKEKIFIINYFDKEEMRWYEQEKYRPREKFINTQTGEVYKTEEECNKAKAEYFKEATVNNTKTNIEFSKFVPLEDYQQSLKNLEEYYIEN